MPKKAKVKKMRAVRGGRARQAPKKPNVNQVVNVFTDRAEPYTTDFRNQYRYGLGFAEYNPFAATTTTQSIQPQSLTESIKVIQPKELEAKQVVEQFPVPFGAPKGKGKNPYESESEGSPRARPIRSDANKPRGSYKEKAITEGRNMQNIFALRAGSETEKEGVEQPQFITSRSNI
jgi:hypothetical protein